MLIGDPSLTWTQPLYRVLEASLNTTQNNFIDLTLPVMSYRIHARTAWRCPVHIRLAMRSTRYPLCLKYVIVRMNP